jgi:hypothetical protein
MGLTRCWDEAKRTVASPQERNIRRPLGSALTGHKPPSLIVSPGNKRPKLEPDQ